MKRIRRTGALGVRVLELPALPRDLCGQVSFITGIIVRIMRTKLDIFFKTLLIVKSSIIDLFGCSGGLL